MQTTSGAANAPEPDAFAIRLETEGVVALPDRPFHIQPEEMGLLSPRLSNGRAKNISWGGVGEVRGATASPAEAERLALLMARYARWARELIGELAPRYAPVLEGGRTSLRTRQVDEPTASPRKDDQRLHVDAFASQPTGGRRILRVFSNINPAGEARVWRVGEPFEAYAGRWIGRAGRVSPLKAWAIHRLGITRGRRTPYDALMLALHDGAKTDEVYQRQAPRREVAFPAGSSWIAYTDATVHAAVHGQFALEQTFYLPVSAMAAPGLSPLRILERMTGRTLC